MTRVSGSMTRAAVCSLAMSLLLVNCGGGSASSGTTLPVTPGAPAAASVQRAATSPAQNPGISPESQPNRLRDIVDRGTTAMRPALVGSSNPVTAAPPIGLPDESPCVVTLFKHDLFENYSPQAFSYAPSCPGPWAKVILRGHFAVTEGIQYDRTGSIWLGSNVLWFGTTAEPSPNFGPKWNIEKDVTDLSSLFTAASSGQITLGNTVNSTYNGVISGDAELDFYAADTENPAPAVPDQVIGISSGPTGGTVGLSSPSSTMGVTQTFPQNIEKAYLDLYLQPQFDDEFWYSCFPNNLATELDNCGGTAFREGEVTIDGQPAGVSPIYPWIFTGGIDPNLWIPIVGVQTLDFKPYQVDLTPFAGLLNNGQQHTVSISVFNDDNYFSGTGSLELYLDHGATQDPGAVTSDTIATAPNATVDTAVNVNGQTGTAKGSIKTYSTHPVSVSGYINTSHGQVQTSVQEQISFSNVQQLNFNSTQSVQNIQQLSTVQRQVTTTGPDGQQVMGVTFTYPLTLDFAYVVASSGTATQTTTVAQGYDTQRTISPHNPGNTALQELLELVNSTDQLTVANNQVTNAQGSSNEQYQQIDGTGYCYNKVLTSSNYVLTSTALESCK